MIILRGFISERGKPGIKDKRPIYREADETQVQSRSAPKPGEKAEQ